MIEAQGYGDALALRERFQARYQEAEKERRRFYQMFEDAKAIWLRLAKCGRKFGLDTLIVDAENELRALTPEVDLLEWFDIADGATLNGYAPPQTDLFSVLEMPLVEEAVDIPPSVSTPILRVDVEETWQSAVDQACARMTEQEARSDAIQNTSLLLDYRRQTLDDVLREYETYGAALTWEETEDAQEKGLLAREGSPSVDLRSPYVPYYAWIREVYKSVEPESASKQRAYQEVQRLFDEEYGESMRETHGKEMLLSKSTIRRALGEL
ncbi:MAG: hypothetical protein AAGG50_13460 [Bacteroidota bacterium]